MNVTERRARIARLLLTHGEVGIDELAERFSVSTMTARRDLEALESDGVARRVRNGAIGAGVGLGTGMRAHEPPFGDRERRARAAKVAIGAAAAGLVSDGQTLAVDSGTTALAMARGLVGSGLAITVVTPSLGVATTLAHEPAMRVLVTGGEVRPDELSLVGAEACEAFARVNVDLFFMGVGGLHLERGLTDYSPEEARVKQAAAASAERVVALVDRTKFDRVFLARVLHADDVHVLVTDAPADDPVLSELIGRGVEVRRADPSDDAPLSLSRDHDRS